ncbi:hypothetical protein CRYUN_Cryun39dG0039000 [Craigia yunnanensis]
MKSQNYLCLFLVFFACLISFSHAHKSFYVGGKDGWVLEPKEKYNNWAGKQRFQVNDTLIFKYEKGSDSVLLVHKDDYSNCNIKNPVKNMTSGSSEFQFPQSGPFYFISGKEGHCQKGQKLITVVMAVRNGTPSTHPPHAAPPKLPVPVTKPPAKSPFPSPGPAYSPKHHGPVANPPQVSSPTPATSTHYSPSSGPSYSPMAHGPIAYPPKAISPSTASSPNSPTPFSSPQISPYPYSISPQASTPSPSYAPVEAPTPASTISSPPAPPQAISPSPEPTPAAPLSSPPAPPQDISPSPDSSKPPTGSQEPSGRQTGTPSNEPSPSPSSTKSSAGASYSSLMVLAASVLLSIVFSSFVGGF